MQHVLVHIANKYTSTLPFHSPAQSGKPNSIYPSYNIGNTTTLKFKGKVKRITLFEQIEESIHFNQLNAGKRVEKDKLPIVKIKKTLKDNPEYNYKMIILARESRGFGQQELSELIGTNAGNLSRVEKGIQTPMPELVEKISKVLDYPLSFFKQENEVRHITTLLFRKKLSISKKEIAKADALVNIYGIHLDNLLKYAELICSNYPLFDVGDNITPETAAQYVRQFWNLPSGKIENLTQLLENKGIVIVPLDFEGIEIDGLSLVSNKQTPVIFINKAIPTDRYQLLLAQELGHLVMHLKREIKVQRDPEEEAYQFASEFLMPAKDIYHSLNELNIEKLQKLKLQWKVGIKDLLKRAYYIKAINNNHKYQYLCKLLAKLSTEQTLPQEYPSLLKEMIHVYMEQLHYSEEQLASHLNLNLEEFKNRFLNQSKLSI